MVPNHIPVSTPSNNLFPEAVLHLDMCLLVGGVVPLPVMLRHGVHRQHPADPLLGGPVVVVVVVVVVVDGVDGVPVDHRWPPSHRLRGLGEAAEVPGPNHLHSFPSKLGVVSQLP
jgi:hypothetical protein